MRYLKINMGKDNPEKRDGTGLYSGSHEGEGEGKGQRQKASEPGSKKK